PPSSAPNWPPTSSAPGPRACATDAGPPLPATPPRGSLRGGSKIPVGSARSSSVPMMPLGDRFDGRDPTYLRQVQYRDGTQLTARASLHVKYSPAAVAWFPWLVRRVRWPARSRILEVGCGTGWLWLEASAHLPYDLDITLTDLSEGMVREAL